MATQPTQIRRPAAPAQQASQPTQAVAVRAREAPIAVGPAARLSTPEQLGAAAEKILGQGNLATMSPTERARYLLYVCQLLGLNPFTRPFEIITFQGQTVLYARKEATEQLARTFGVTTEVKARGPDTFLGVYTTEVRASCAVAAGGTRFADGLGAVPYLDGKGDMLPIAERANVVKKSETQARRRAVLGLLGLGILDRAGERDPDLMIDARGAVAGRTARELPTSTATAAEIFDEEPPDTDHGGPRMRSEVLTPTDAEIAAAAAAEVEAGVVPAVVEERRPGVEFDGPRIVARGSRRSAAVRALGLSEAARQAVGSVLLRWLESTPAAPPAPPAEDETEAAWSSWVDGVTALLDGSAANG